jgi:hypothetical protein
MKHSLVHIAYGYILAMLIVTEALSLTNPQILTALTSISDCPVEFSVNVVTSVLNTC